MERDFACVCLSLVGILSCTRPEPVPAPAPQPLTHPNVAVPASAPAPVAMQAESVSVAVEFLLDAIATSPLTFIRNGSKHSGADASQHIRSKYDYFQKDIATAEQFIEKAATKSELSGKLYLVRFEDGKEVTLADWLTSKLVEWRAARPH